MRASPVYLLHAVVGRPYPSLLWIFPTNTGIALPPPLFSITFLPPYPTGASIRSRLVSPPRLGRLAITIRIPTLDPPTSTSRIIPTHRNRTKHEGKHPPPLFPELIPMAKGIADHILWN